MKMKDSCKKYDCVEIREDREYLINKCELLEEQIKDLRQKYLQTFKMLNQSRQEVATLKKMFNPEVQPQLEEPIDSANNVQEENNQDIESFFEFSMVVPKVEPQDATEDDLESNSYDQNSYLDENLRNDCDNQEIKDEPQENSDADERTDSPNDTGSLDLAVEEEEEEFQEDSGGSSSQMQVCDWLLPDGDKRRKKCGDVFPSIADLVSHFNKAHMRRCKFDGYVCSWNNCKRGGVPFRRKCYFVAHFRIHTGERPFQCLHEGCNKTFKSLCVFRKHQQMHTDIIFRCTHPGCYRKFTCHSTMLGHYRMRHMYQCVVPECGKVCRSAAALTEHKKKHAVKKAYQCRFPGCKEVFHLKDALSRHWTKHVPSIVFNCPFEVCGRKFKSLATYRKHFHTHSSN